MLFSGANLCHSHCPHHKSLFFILYVCDKNNKPHENLSHEAHHFSKKYTTILSGLDKDF